MKRYLPETLLVLVQLTLIGLIFHGLYSAFG